MTEGKLTVVIITFNGDKWIRPCLKSVKKCLYEKMEIIVIDNNSQDQTVKIIKSEFSDVMLIQQKKNSGFGRAANVGIKTALSQHSDYILLLNQDITIEKDSINKLINAFNKDTKIAILSPFQMTYDGSAPDPAFERLINSNTVNSNYEIKTVIGAAMMFRAAIFKTVGLFDPLFFLYHEEGDLCRRARYHGYRIHYLPDAKIFHWHAQLFPHKMRLVSKISAFLGYYIYVLKDPFEPFSNNVLSSFREMKEWVFRRKIFYMIFKRIVLASVACSFLFILMPQIYKSRKTNFKRYRLLI